MEIMEGDNNTRTFDMGALRSSLPRNQRGLSRYYSGKARSFTCMADVRCLEDLKKPERPDAKKRKKHTEKKNFAVPAPYPPIPCRRVSSTTQFATPCVGV
ncbi:hypothetical protein RchiOBHm_Chr6g0266031 [Rosa chinensis]|uniref:Uncharacterized protein n=1 Tax=Rosa chinensis TaxID=74649 RepID=A0A2P6PPJ4_ROSCH|nr:uncharacterized protein LOC112169991 [Rosa chinensis]PRQ23858.1 hypothetical protein RchiOBHm_Chr6g0266031 [Rosa chinensis]